MVFKNTRFDYKYKKVGVTLIMREKKFKSLDLDHFNSLFLEMQTFKMHLLEWYARNFPVCDNNLHNFIKKPFKHFELISYFLHVDGHLLPSSLLTFFKDESNEVIQATISFCCMEKCTKCIQEQKDWILPVWQREDQLPSGWKKRKCLNRRSFFSSC